MGGYAEASPLFQLPLSQHYRRTEGLKGEKAIKEVTAHLIQSSWNATEALRADSTLHTGEFTKLRFTTGTTKPGGAYEFRDYATLVKHFEEPEIRPPSDRN